MNQYRVELRTGFAKTDYTYVNADNHADAKWKAHHNTGLVVLSTQLIG